MSRKAKVTGQVLSQRALAENIFDLKIQTDLADEAGAGQFVGVYPKDKSTLLPRPISICEVNREEKNLRLVYRIAGKGTKEFSSYQEGDEVEILGVLGNGYDLTRAAGKRTVLLGGGIGIPPMLETARELHEQGEKVTVILGYRDAQLFLKDEFEAYADVLVATEDGSVGTKGNVLDAMREHQVEAEVIMACGPMPMLRAIKAYAEEKSCDAYISLEERMACGVGACLGCVCKTTKKDAHSHVNNARICTDGPVFDAREVEI